VVRRLAREDQYLSEGILHVQERNVRWSAGDHSSAWRENLILETYYRPVLGVSYPQAGATIHAWPAEQRADAERRAREAMRTGYVSAADKGFIRTWPWTGLWAGALLLAALMVAAGFAGERRLATGARSLPENNTTGTGNAGPGR